MNQPSYAALRIHPVGIWLVVLALIFLVEYGVMIVLPWMLPEHPTRFWESAVDAFVLAVIVAPALWLIVVRPLQQAMNLQVRFLAHSLASIEAERRYIAHELHDGVGQSLTLLVSGLRSLPERTQPGELGRRSGELQQLAQTALKDLKKLSLGLRPSLLDDLGLAPAIERVASDIRENHPLELRIDVAAITGTRFPEAVETALFRIFQESLNNVVKHSAARHASVQVQRHGGMILLQVSDDGCGFEPVRPKTRSQAAGHLGLIGMRERAALVGGRLDMDSAPGKGTRVQARIPEGGSEWTRSA